MCFWKYVYFLQSLHVSIKFEVLQTTSLKGKEQIGHLGHPQWPTELHCDVGIKIGSSYFVQLFSVKAIVSYLANYTTTTFESSEFSLVFL